MEMAEPLERAEGGILAADNEVGGVEGWSSPLDTQNTISDGVSVSENQPNNAEFGPAGPIYSGTGTNQTPGLIGGVNEDRNGNSGLWSAETVTRITQESTGSNHEQVNLVGQPAQFNYLQGLSQEPMRFGTGNQGSETTNKEVARREPIVRERQIRSERVENTPDVGNARRKRNRLEDERSGVGFTTMGAGEALEALMEDVHKITKSCQRGSVLKEAIDLSYNRLSVEIAKLLTRVVQKQEENNHLLQQIVFLQTCGGQEKTSSRPTYAEVVSGGGGEEIANGRRLPAVRIPATVRLSPAEKTLIIKNDVKDVMASKLQQQQFRTKLKEAVGEDLAAEISAVRPTRYGGFTVITSSETARDRVAERIVEKEVAASGKVVRPRMRRPRMVCRMPLETSPAELLKQLYSRHNPEFMKVPQSCRWAKINITRLGWVFEFSTAEALACDAQGGKVRYSFGLEARLEEFIPLQQCYNCCAFGHEARDCQAVKPKCRLCGQEGHSGRACPHKEDRRKWRCYNCKRHNEQKGTHLPIDHAAAQMHICAVALQERELRKEQLRAAGVYTSQRSPSTIEGGTKHPSGGARGEEVPEQYQKQRMNSKDAVIKETAAHLSNSHSKAGTARKAAEARRRREAHEAKYDGVITRQMRNARGTTAVPGVSQNREANRGEGRVRWDAGVSMGEPGSAERRSTQNKRGQRGGDGGMGERTRTPVGNGTRSTNQSPGNPRRSPLSTTVTIHSDMEDDELDDLDL